MYRRFIEEVDSCAFVEFTAIKFCSLLVSSVIMAQVLAVYANDNQQLLVPKKQLAAKQAGICCFLVDSKFSWFLWSCFLQHSSTSERSKPGWPSFWKYSKALENKWSWGCGNRYWWFLLLFSLSHAQFPYYSLPWCYLFEMIFQRKNGLVYMQVGRDGCGLLDGENMPYIEVTSDQNGTIECRTNQMLIF